LISDDEPNAKAAAIAASKLEGAMPTTSSSELKPLTDLVSANCAQVARDVLNPML